VKVALISPFSLMREIPNTGYHLVLAHLLQDPEYRAFYQTAEGYKILDNGAAEGSLVSNRELIKLAKEIGANEIIVPDVMGNFTETVSLMHDFAGYAEEHPEFSYTAVLQGVNTRELILAYETTRDVGYVSNIALPRYMQHIDPHERILWAKVIRERFVSNIDIHCLGATSWTREVLKLAEDGCARGIDTSMPIVLGLAGIRLSESRDYVPRAMDYFHIEATEEQKEIIHDNVNTYLTWAQAS
jgi:hypothetical protein